ncbi:MAG: hypothetical protein FJ098_12430, partial [Deltaproteobacteria bacterium]|nr:hypothetical protein [Deltaproteobacteria bacterium]
MLDELAFSAAPRGELADTAWLGWRASLLEAVGKLRDPRAVPVLRAAVSRGPAERLLVAAAAGALGKLLTEDEARWLVARLPAVTGEARLGLLQGLGHCRRGVAAEALAAALTAAPGDEEARVLARALGTVGSSWAWRTPVVAASGEEDAVRGTAARALAGAWMLYRGQAQKTIGHALLVVAHTDTAALLRMAVTDGDEDTRSAAEELIRRFEDRSFRGEP